MKILTKSQQSLAIVLTLLAGLFTFMGSASGANVALQDAIGVYVDAPFVQGSYIASRDQAGNNSIDSLTDSYEIASLQNPNSTPCPIIGTVGTYAFDTGVCSIYGSDYGGAITTNSVATLGNGSSSLSDFIYTTGTGTTVTLNRNSNYIGFWWAAGSNGNTVSFYQGDNLILNVTADDICALVKGSGICTKPGDSTAKITAVDGTTQYVKDDYYGHPQDRSNIAATEPFMFVHFFAQNSLTFDKIKFSGANFEFDNLTIAQLSGSELTPKDSLIAVGSYGQTYSLTYDSQGGSSVSNQTLVDGGNISVTSTVPSRSGYRFTGWNTTSGGTGTNYATSSTYPASGTVSGNGTLYAQWTLLSGLPSCSPTSQTGNANDIYGNSATLPENTTVIAFTSLTDCNWTVPNSVEQISYVVVGGGGGGGSDAASGGAGGAVVTGSLSVSSGQIISVSVGAGGSGGAAGANNGLNGNVSDLYSGNQVISAAGGGHGSKCGYNGNNCTTNLGGQNGTQFGTGGVGTWLGNRDSYPTSGSDGVQTSITGISVTLGSGGGGGGGGTLGLACTGGAGGNYSGGNGFDCNSNSAASNGLASTGGGGGGGGTGGSGANGIVIIRFSQTFGVSYDGNGNLSGQVPVDSNTYGFNSSANVLTNSGGLSRVGYAFSGWFTQVNGTSTDYAPGSTINLSNDATLYAKWDQMFYTVYYPQVGFDWSHPSYDDTLANLSEAKDISVSIGSHDFSGQWTEIFENDLTYTFPAITENNQYVSKYEVYDDCGNRLPDISMTGTSINFQTYLTTIGNSSKLVGTNLAECAEAYYVGSYAHFNRWPNLFLKAIWASLPSSSGNSSSGSSTIESAQSNLTKVSLAKSKAKNNNLNLNSKSTSVVSAAPKTQIAALGSNLIQISSALPNQKIRISISKKSNSNSNLTVQTKNSSNSNAVENKNSKIEIQLNAVKIFNVKSATELKVNGIKKGQRIRIKIL